MPDQDGADPDQGEPQQITLMRRLVEMSAQRNEMSAQRTEMSAERSYMNAERTLSVWIRTSLAVMIVGIAVDRFELFVTDQSGVHSAPDGASRWVGIGLVALGVLMAVLTAVRFSRYAASYRRAHAFPDHHGPVMAPAFGTMVAFFGIALLVLLVVSG